MLDRRSNSVEQAMKMLSLKERVFHLGTRRFTLKNFRDEMTKNKCLVHKQSRMERAHLSKGDIHVHNSAFDGIQKEQVLPVLCRKSGSLFSFAMMCLTDS